MPTYIIRFEQGEPIEFSEWSAARRHIIQTTMPFDPYNEDDLRILAAYVYEDYEAGKIVVLYRRSSWML